jgi:hypothetical protein
MTYGGDFGRGTTDSPLYADVRVPLLGQDGSPWMIMGRVSGALRSAGASPEAVSEYLDEASSGSYEHLLQVTMKWVDTDPDDYLEGT